ncbi:hypothetical protein NEUTE1DRAFT_44355 [Neurospora tetrasperma FGSC 2508]|uniref:Ubiquitin-like domain-containing protein n=1 Tax=Neurospora tetrasperma (strain FGSC 2508 / ATCC MYA-4615 / P0657) TaxID=510951 RepID=F8MRK9_NEUT8|nr:uncharacterized protein NEUTE1DRAFT_44355 [Neurospora tetrasperma FGSC 2508]EGO56910.1 hypothetical protein NEUTE1DRAFT_44355 [Neurospora tetrasperma FGSC 2508]EGZ70187.1 hypothetical protein NEUTE2DRAFT_69033 [Neurospora tetrasperma FGSC 2509]
MEISKSEWGRLGELGLFWAVRFSASLPDLHLDIPSPNRTTIVALKHRIRERLHSSSKDSKDETTAKAARSRLRFIHAGKILPDTAVVSSVLRPPPPPPMVMDAKGKGKAVDRQHQQQRVYVNCSIGDELTDEELATEAAAAAFVPAPVGSVDSNLSDIGSGAGSGKTSRTTGLQPSSSSLSTGESRSRINASAGQATTTTTTDRNRPRGFDRFLSAGFTPAEVNQLRLQFTSIQASRFTPDTMPSPDTLRSMEDAWIDNNHGGVGGPGMVESDDGSGLVPEPIGAETDGFNGMVDTLVKGMFIGGQDPLVRWIGDVFMEMAHWVGAWDFCRFVAAFGIMSWSIYRFAGGRVQEWVEEE